MEDLSSKTILCFDYGLFASWAPKLAESFGRVLYYCPFKSAFPRSQQYMIGRGLPNVERVTSFPDALRYDRPDICFFPDVYDGDLQEQILEDYAIPVWGCQRGENLELCRWQTKMFLKKDLGLPVQPVERIIGVPALREFLQEHDDQYVKISLLRGDFETFHHITYRLSEPLLDEIEGKLGPNKDDKEFIVEEAINDAIEVGYDGWTIDGHYPNPSLFGYEIKDVSYIGVVRPYPKLPRQVKEVNEKLAPWFEEKRYRGFWSSEIRIPANGKPYLTDPCCRAGSPPSELYQEIFDNWGEIIWAGAHGEVIAPKPKGNYGVEVLIHSQWADSHWQAVFDDPDVRKHLKLRNVCQKGENLYVAPQVVGLPEIGAVVACDDSLLGAIKKVKDMCDHVSGYSIDLNLERIADAIDVISTAAKAGIPFSEDPLPSKGQVAQVLTR